MNRELTCSKLIVLVSIFSILFGNMAFILSVLDVYPLNLKNGLFLFSLPILFGCANIIIFGLFCHKRTIKPILIAILLISSAAAYFMDTYYIVIDDSMIDNIIKTDISEFLDLISLKLALYLIFLGILPSVFVYKIQIMEFSLKKSIICRIKLIALSFSIAISVVLVFGDFYASFFREHKLLRSYANPSFYMYSVVKYTKSAFANGAGEIRKIGLDARTSASDGRRNLVIFVVGETARADRFSLNGYEKKTNPYLEKEAVISFRNTWSCGTSTADSVPCMFSIYGRSDFSKNKAKTTENVLDVLQRAGIHVVWLDNNSSSKGVAVRVGYESYKTPDKNPICDSECRDEGMLANLQPYIDAHPSGDIFIVLHQMGNHGPAYFKRYPPSFEKFRPTCQTNQLEDCSLQEINNAYDNAIRYTDYFLSKVITLLKKNSGPFDSTLFYVSDHGESLGEKGLYLHGMPYWVAPDVQKHVPMIMWFSNRFVHENKINLNSLKKKIDNEYSHDHIFHTILSLMRVKTTVYNEALDIFTFPPDD